MFNQIQIDLLNGAMLGDGYIGVSGNRSINARFSYSSNKKDHVDYVFEYFKEYCLSGVKYRECFDKRTNKIYTKYTFMTKQLPQFTEIYEKWYINKTKIIPNNLILTQKTVLLWYIGDGSLNKNNGEIILATNCFNLKQLETIIIPQMNLFDVNITFGKNRQPLIRIPRKNVKQFLEYIGPCPFESYQYKWNHVEYKIKKFASNHRIKRTTEEEKQDIIKLYDSGMSVFNIAKQFNYNDARVKYCLKKNGSYIPFKNSNLMRFLFSDDIDNMIKMRKNGHKWKDLEELYGTTECTLVHHIKKDTLVERSF